MTVRVTVRAHVTVRVIHKIIQRKLIKP